MGRITTDGVYKPSAGTYLYATMDYTITTTNNTVFVDFTTFADSDYSVQNGVGCCADYVDWRSGAKGDGPKGYGVTNRGDNIAYASGQWSFSRETSDYKVSLAVKVWGTSYGGYNGYNNGSTSGSASNPLGRTWTDITIPARIDAPPSPSSLTCTRNSDTQNTLTWKNNPSVFGTYASLELQRSLDGGGFALLATLGGTLTSYTDKTTQANHYYQYQIRATNSVASSGYVLSNISYNTPAIHTACTNTRNSDTQNTVSWTCGANPSATKTTYIERSIDGGAYSALASVLGTVTSYVDKATSTNHAYTYRVRSGLGTLYSGYAPSNTTYNSPAATGKPTPARNTDNSVIVSFTNPAITQTATELQRSTDASTWTIVKTQAGTNVVSITDTPGGGTFYYRCRNTRGALTSPYSEISEPVVTIMPPATPTLIAPVSGAIVQTSDADITFEWTHNPLDGSVQAEAILQYSTDSGNTWTSVTVAGNAQQYVLTNNFAVNTAVTWRVCTKGADPSFGAYSSSNILNVYQSPMVAIVSPTDEPIGELPMIVAWNYIDLSGTQQQYLVEILSLSEQVLFSCASQNEDTSVVITSNDYLPHNQTSLFVRVSVRSTTSLTSFATLTITTNYLEPPLPAPVIEVDFDSASVALAVFETLDTAKPDTVSLGIFRKRKDGSMLAIADRVLSGTAVVDYYPPIDETLVYVFVAYAQTGVVSSVEHTVHIKSKLSVFINFGEGYRQVAKVALDTKWDKSLKHTKELFETAGIKSKDQYPLVFYGVSKQKSGNITGSAIRSEHILSYTPKYALVSDIEKASEWTGSVVLRLPFETPFAADIEVSQSFANRFLSAVSITWGRVRDHGLVI